MGATDAPDTGTLRDDLLALLHPWAHLVTTRPYARVIAGCTAFSPPAWRDGRRTPSPIARHYRTSGTREMGRIPEHHCCQRQQRHSWAVTSCATCTSTATAPLRSTACPTRTRWPMPPCASISPTTVRSTNAATFANVMDPEDYARFPDFDADPRQRRWNLWAYIDGAPAVRLALAHNAPGIDTFVINADTVMSGAAPTLLPSSSPASRSPESSRSTERGARDHAVDREGAPRARLPAEVHLAHRRRGVMGERRASESTDTSEITVTRSPSPGSCSEPPRCGFSCPARRSTWGHPRGVTPVPLVDSQCSGHDGRKVAKEKVQQLLVTCHAEDLRRRTESRSSA